MPILFAQSILCQAHYKTYYKVSRLPTPGNQRFTGRRFSNMFYGGPGGHCPRVLNTFLFTSVLIAQGLQQFFTTVTVLLKILLYYGDF